MSQADLMQKAKEIETKAAETEYRQLLSLPRAGAGINKEDLEQKYQGRAQPLFEPFTRIPDPSAYDGPINDLHSAMGKLSHGAHMNDPVSEDSIGANEDLKAIETAAGDLQGWSGEAAYAFKANFLDPFPAKASNQFIALGGMKGAMQAEQELWNKTQDDIANIAEKALTALDNVGSCGKSDFEFTLSVFSAVAAIGAIPFTGGASAVTFAAVGAASAVGGAAQKGYEAVKASGGSAEQVVSSMEDAIGKLTEHISKERGRITKSLNDCAGAITQGKSHFVSPRPKLAGMEGENLTSGMGVGGHD
ncbi:hypothetical protein [Actinopolyspora saharensis]|uniref:hypothetical protein n=1 Tax=Actinopolyspora saharensis TaxID=995062 RepID=UPI003F66CE50